MSKYSTSLRNAEITRTRHVFHCPHDFHYSRLPTKILILIVIASLTNEELICFLTRQCNLLRLFVEIYYPESNTSFKFDRSDRRSLSGKVSTQKEELVWTVHSSLLNEGKTQNVLSDGAIKLLMVRFSLLLKNLAPLQQQTSNGLSCGLHHHMCLTEFTVYTVVILWERD